MVALVAFSAPRASAQLATFEFTPFEFDYSGGITSPALLGSEFIVGVHQAAGDPFSVIFNLQNVSNPAHPNISATSPTVTRIYFDDNYGILNFGAVSLFDQSPTTSFNVGGGAPPNVPGGVNIGFSSDYRITANAPPPMRGLDPGEFVMIQVGLQAGFSASDVVAAMSLDNPSANLRMAIHVQEIGLGSSTEQSASFVTVIPEPGSALLLLSSGMLLQLRRKRR